MNSPAATQQNGEAGALGPGLGIGIRLGGNFPRLPPSRSRDEVIMGKKNRGRNGNGPKGNGGGRNLPDWLWRVIEIAGKWLIQAWR